MVNVKFIKALSYLSMLETMSQELRKIGDRLNTFTAYMRYMDAHEQFFPLIQVELLDSGRAQSLPVADFIEPYDNELVAGTILMNIDAGKGKADYRYFLLNPEATAFLDAQNNELENMTTEEQNKLFSI